MMDHATTSMGKAQEHDALEHDAQHHRHEALESTEQKDCPSAQSLSLIRRSDDSDRGTAWPQVQ